MVVSQGKWVLSAVLYDVSWSVILYDQYFYGRFFEILLGVCAVVL